MKLTKFKESEVRNHFRSSKLVVKNLGLEFFLAPSSYPYGRILVVTPRKSGSSVERNLIRRRIKSIFIEEGYYKSNVDWLVIVRKDATAMPFQKLKTEISDVFAKYQNLNPKDTI